MLIMLLPPRITIISPYWKNWLMFIRFPLAWGSINFTWIALCFQIAWSVPMFITWDQSFSVCTVAPKGFMEVCGFMGVLPCGGPLIRISGGHGTSPCATSSLRVPCLPFSLMTAHLSGFVKAARALGFACITPLLIHAPYCQFTKRKRQSHRPTHSSKLHTPIAHASWAFYITLNNTLTTRKSCFGRTCDYYIFILK